MRKLLILALRLAQKVSMGFKSGEYGGKKSSVQFAFSISVFVFSDLWKVALSKITTCPGFRAGTKQVSIQRLKRSV